MQLPLLIASIAQDPPAAAADADPVLPRPARVPDLSSEADFPWLVAVGIAVAIVLALVGARKVLDRYRRADGEHQLRDQLTMLGLTLVGLLVVIMNLPISPDARSDLLALLGVVLSAAIALSSTTFLSNAMGALMLRSVRNFRLGDFIQVGEHFGRVTERGLFHTEIQTEDRDLVTLPNMFVVTNPVRVLRSDGTIVSCTVSLGYDTPRRTIEPLLTAAAEKVGLSGAFVQVTELGDFSVSYRVAGMLTEVKQIISFRSGLRKAVMDSLHGGGVEIVSPTFMNTRAFDPQRPFIPRSVDAARSAPERESAAPEELIFDKADEAESLEQSRERLVELEAAIEELKGRVAAGGDRVETTRKRLERLEQGRVTLDEEIKARATQLKETGH